MIEGELLHYGILRKSGRYPWGSGENPHQRNRQFLDHVEELKKQGLSETEIARGLGITTTELRAAKAIAKNEQKKAAEAQALKLKEKGLSNVAIGERMGINESSVRSLLNPAMQEKSDILTTISDKLQSSVDEKGYIQIGKGVETELGISETRLSTAVAMLKEKGYEVHTVQVEQLGTGDKTYIKVLAPKGTTYADVAKNLDKIKTIQDYSSDGGRSFEKILPPKHISLDRVGVKYAEDGGADMDGVIQIRPGAKDLSLGSSRYAQVRIAVGKDHYLKGMAVYSDDLPDGVDILFNTNKFKKDTPNKVDAFKKMKDDPDNPFGSIIKRQKGALNLVNEEGDWSEWSAKLSSQMLSKQSPKLAKEQLEKAYSVKKADLDEIMSLTNPLVKRKLLETAADNLDSSATKLKAAKISGTQNHVILPVNELKPTEIYAPNYRNGDKVALIRHPHGGIFEIPELTVNNRNPAAKKLLGNARDAVGIHSKVAQQLSGADFDGDTVLVIPNNNRKIKSSSPLAGLKDFDTKLSYPGYPGMKTMKDTQKQMGDISNLITDMTIKGANQAEIARAVRHSMVVIDAEKHGLNYKQSYSDNGIAELKTKYQGGPRKGASTLISRASSEARVPKSKLRPASLGGPVDKLTGKKVYIPTNESYVDKKGRTIVRTEKRSRMSLADDAYSLSSGTPMESVYASHANKLKSLANQARKTAISQKPISYSPSAKTAYQNEVNTLRSKLNVALKNKPRERQAQLIANTVVRAKRQANPDMDHNTLKKVKTLALEQARARVGAHKTQIIFTPREWEAVQAGAISSHMLDQILNNSDLDSVRSMALPRTSTALPPARLNRARQMMNAGYTQAEAADVLGVSVSTLSQALKG